MDSLLRGLLDEEGRIVRYASKYKKRMAATLYIAQKFEPGRVYTEQEVNGVIHTWVAFADYVLVRRDLVDLHCLDRTPDGREYRLVETLPTIEQLFD